MLPGLRQVARGTKHINQIGVREPSQVGSRPGTNFAGHLQRFGRPAGGQLQPGTGARNHIKVWSEGLNLREFNQCFVVSFERRQQAQPPDGRRHPQRIDGKCPVGFLQRQINPSLILQNQPQPVVGLGVVGVQFTGPPTFLFGFVQPTFTHFNSAHRRIDIRQVRVEYSCAFGRHPRLGHDPVSLLTGQGQKLAFVTSTSASPAYASAKSGSTSIALRS